MMNIHWQTPRHTLSLRWEACHAVANLQSTIQGVRNRHDEDSKMTAHQIIIPKKCMAHLPQSLLVPARKTTLTHLCFFLEVIFFCCICTYYAIYTARQDWWTGSLSPGMLIKWNLSSQVGVKSRAKRLVGCLVGWETPADILQPGFLFTAYRMELRKGVRRIYCLTR